MLSVPFSSFSAFFWIKSIFMILFGSSYIFHVSNTSNISSRFLNIRSTVTRAA